MRHPSPFIDVKRMSMVMCMKGLDDNDDGVVDHVTESIVISQVSLLPTGPHISISPCTHS